MRKITDRIKNNKGSVTLFVLIAMIFFLIFVLTMYVQVNSKKSAQLKEIEKIQAEYNSTNMDEIYDSNEGNIDGKIRIILYTMDGNIYNLNQWTNQNLRLEIKYPSDAKEEDKYYYKDGVKIKYSENEIIEENCVISTEYKEEKQEVRITRIDKNAVNVTYNKNGDEYLVKEGENKANISTKITADDGNGSGVKSIQYIISTSTSEPAENAPEWKEIANQEVIEEGRTGGVYYVYVKAVDNAGNIKIYKSNQFKINYQVIYDLNGGKGGPSNQIKIHGTNLKLSSEQPTKEGYVFEGWGLTDNSSEVKYRPGSIYTEDATIRLYAIYSKTITATFKYFDGEVKTKEISKKIYNDSISVNITVPNIENVVKDEITYIGRGWSTSDSENANIEVKANQNIEISKDVTYYASYSGTITLSYNANGGTGAPKAETGTGYLNYEGKITPASITISSTEPTKPEMNFQTWNTARDGLGTSYMAGDIIKISKDTMLFAIWGDNTYIVIYDYKTNGGTSSTKTSDTVNYGENIDLTPTAIKPGYTFVGWNTNKDATTKLDTSKMERSNVTLYAIYSKTITATFNYYNAGAKTVSGTAYNNATTVEITTPTIENVSKDGITYNARGWSTANTGNATINVNSGAKVILSANTTYYASYTYQVTLSYDANGGSGAPASQTGTAYMNYVGTKIDASITISSTKPTRTGYTFQNWNIKSDGTGTTYVLGGKINLANNATLYAIWKDGIAPTVTLSPNGGTYIMPITGNAKISTKITATDNESGLKTLQYAWSTSSTTEPTTWSNFTNGATVSKTDISNPGTYYLWTNVVDNAGNRATDVKKSNGFIVKSNSDTTAKITITPNTTAWTNQDVIGTVTYGSALTSNRKAGFGTTLDAAKSAISASTALKVIATSNGYIYAEATDMAGNKVSEYLTVTNIDKTAPEIISTTKGTDKFSDSTFKSGLNGIDVYNLNNNGQVSINRVSASSDIPTDSGYMLEIKTTGSSTSPGRGGYVQWLNVQSNHVYRHRIIAKIPKGYKIQRAANSCGNNATHTWLTSQEGTGDWELYEYETDCGSSGTFETMGHIYIDKTTATSDIVTWQVAYSNIIDLNGGPAIFRLGDVAFNSGLNTAIAYNNSNSGKVTLNRVAKSSDSPSTSTHMLEIKTTGTPTSPGLGGFYQMIDSGANQVFRHRIVAKIPKGYKMMFASNSCGDGAVFSWLTPQEGTGEWEVYEYEVICGSTGTFSTFGYIYLDKIDSSSSTNVTWYVQYSSVINTSKYMNKGTMKINIKDDSSGIYKYGYSSSSTVEPTNYMINNPRKNVAILDLKISDYNNEYLWVKDVAGNTKVIRTKHKTPPQIASQPQNATVNSGSTASFTVSVTAGYPENISYQWQWRPAGVSTWYNCTNDATGAHGPTKQEVNATSTANGYQYRCIISNGVYTIYTNVVTLTVNEVAHTCNTNGYCTTIHSSGVSWLCECGSYHTTHRHPMCTICGKKSPVSWWKCPNYPEGVPMPCK